MSHDDSGQGPERLAALLLESNDWTTGVKLNQKFTGREARMMAEWLLARGVSLPDSEDAPPKCVKCQQEPDGEFSSRNPALTICRNCYAAAPRAQQCFACGGQGWYAYGYPKQDQCQTCNGTGVLLPDSGDAPRAELEMDALRAENVSLKANRNLAEAALGMPLEAPYVKRYEALQARIQELEQAASAPDGLRAVVERAVATLDEWRDESQRADLVDIANALRAALGSAPPVRAAPEPDEVKTSSEPIDRATVERLRKFQRGDSQ